MTDAISDEMVIKVEPDLVSSTVDEGGRSPLSFIAFKEESDEDDERVKDEASTNVCQQRKDSAILGAQAQEEASPITFQGQLFPCTHCTKKFISEQFLQRHNASAHPEAPYRCHICRISFFSNEDLDFHIKRHNNKNCDTCGKSFKLYRDLQNHQLDHETSNDISAVVSENIDDVEVSDLTVRTSQKRGTAVSKNKLKKKSAKNSTVGYLKCLKCAMRFISDEFLEEHVRARHSAKTYACQVCHKVFNHRGDLNRHFTVHAEGKGFVCTTCNKAFSQNSTLKLHIKAVHAKERRFVCSECEKSFLQSGDLKKHMVVHTGEKNFVCELCSKAFTQNSSLRLHRMTVHTNVKPFICNICNRGFSCQGNLKQHLAVHGGQKQKPFSCAVCNACFTSKSHMKTHIMDVHSEEKPFTCELCGRSFSRNSSLKTHMAVHTGEKPYGCNFCSKMFATRANLKQHMPFHTGEKPFVCGVCSKSFAHRGNYKSHMAVHNT